MGYLWIVPTRSLIYCSHTTTVVTEPRQWCWTGHRMLAGEGKMTKKNPPKLAESEMGRGGSYYFFLCDNMVLLLLYCIITLQKMFFFINDWWLNTFPILICSLSLQCVWAWACVCIGIASSRSFVNVFCLYVSFFKPIFLTIYILSQKLLCYPHFNNLFLIWVIFFIARWL